MNFESKESIHASCFEGFVTISALRKSKCCEVPDVPGIYFVLRASTAAPKFLSESTGGHFKEKNPTVPVSELERKWVQDALVLNIGKADGLSERLQKYMQFGQGKPVAHWGGRYIWQLQDSGDLVVCWKRTPDIDPEKAEKELIREFESVYHRFPFANLRH